MACWKVRGSACERQLPLRRRGTCSTSSTIRTRPCWSMAAALREPVAAIVGRSRGQGAQLSSRSAATARRPIFAESFRRAGRGRWRWHTRCDRCRAIRAIASFIYTGGTTGMPKGVVWEHRDLNMIGLMAAERCGPAGAERASPNMLPLRRRQSRLSQDGMRPTADARHRAAQSAYGTLLAWWFRRDAARASASARRRRSTRSIAGRPTALVVVGDAFARPILEALDARTGSRWDVASMRLIVVVGGDVERKA